MKRIRRILLCILMITVLCGISIVGNSVVKSENKSKEKKRTAITKEEMKEWAAPDEDILEYYDLGKFSTTLPVVYMNTKGQQILKKNVIWGNIALLDGNGEERPHFFAFVPLIIPPYSQERQASTIVKTELITPAIPALN